MDWQPDWERFLVFVGILVGSYVLMRWLVVPILRRAAHSTNTTWDDLLIDTRFVSRLSWIVPPVVAAVSLPVLELDDDLESILGRTMGVLVVFAVLLALSAFLNAVNEIYQANAPNGNRPIKGYLQVVMLVAIVIGLVTVWVIVSGSSFGAVMAGLAALAAVLLLVFQSTILSVVASLTLTSNDMVRLDDWITVPGTDIDGDVIDIALHTVKVRNFDKTIGTIPTTMLVERPFINWRGIDEAGGRRIKRHLLIDQASVRFLSDEEVSEWADFEPIADHMADKQAALASQPTAPGGKGDPRRLTNLGTFRAYADAYLRAHPDLETESFTAMVRQLQPRPDGLPVEIYAFTSTTDWAEYESTQADIFDHLIAGLGRFDLRIAQAPTGADFSNLVE